MKVAIIGVVGVPAKYGGFETLVENIIGENCSQDIEYTVFCSSKSYEYKVQEYKKAKLKYIDLKANGIQSIFYDIISIFKAINNKADVLLILGVSGCIILPVIRFFSKIKIIVNIDGLEHRRDKWGSKVRKFLKFSERIAVYNADIIIADNKAIQDYVMEEYSRSSEFIAYGGDHVLCNATINESKTLQEYNLTKRDYSFALCRIESENNVHIILEAFAQTGNNLVFVGNWENSLYGKNLLKKYEKYHNIKMIHPIYELPVLHVLRSNCLLYLHGHSAGGTNPSLVEAMFFEKPILAFDCVYNRETTEGKASYFADVTQLMELITKLTDQYQINASSMVEIAQRKYCWKIIASQYENLY